MDDQGRLGTSPHMAAKTSVALGYAGMGEDLAEGHTDRVTAGPALAAQ